MKNGTRSHVHEKHGGVRGGLGQEGEYAEREGRMNGGG